MTDRKRPMHAGNIAPEDIWEPPEELILSLKTFQPRLHLVLPSRRLAAATALQTVGDSISPDIPDDGSYGVAAGYVTGNFTWPQSAWDRYASKGVAVCGIDVWAQNAGTVEDCESGNMPPSDMPGWVQMRRATGVDPTVYTGQNNGWWDCIQAFENAGVTQPHYWVANYTLDPSTPIPAGAIGIQWSDQGGGGAWDISTIVNPWPGVQSGAPDPPAPPPPPRRKRAMLPVPRKDGDGTDVFVTDPASNTGLHSYVQPNGMPTVEEKLPGLWIEFFSALPYDGTSLTVYGWGMDLSVWSTTWTAATGWKAPVPLGTVGVEDK